MTANTNSNDRQKNVTSPGTPGETPHDAATSSDEAMPDHDTTDVEFECPYCDITYQNETLARVHITRTDDADHANRDGLMPETEIIARHTDTGDYIDTITRRPRNINVQAITRDDLPDALTDRHAEIVLAATWNPYEDDYTNLETEALEQFELHGLDDLSYSTIRRVTRRFYRDGTTTDQTPNMTSNTQPETLTDGTAKQQAVIISHLTHPDNSDARIAERIGTAQSYPSQIYDRFDDVLARLDTKIKNGTELTTTIVDDLDRADLDELKEQDLLRDTDADINTLIEAYEHRHGNRDDTGNADQTFDFGVSEYDSMEASPYDDNGQPNADDTTPGTDGHDNTDTDTTADTSDGDQSPIPRDAVETLRKRVVFERRLGERVEARHGNDGQAFRIAFAELIEEELDAILDE